MTSWRGCARPGIARDSSLPTRPAERALSGAFGRGFPARASLRGMSRIPVLLSSSSVFPEPTAAAFELAAKLGYDGVEVMVWTDAVSQDAGALRGLSDHYGVHIGSIHAPC